MSDLNSLISDEEYLPLPKQLQPTPASKWTSITPDDIGDPALRLTPDRNSKPRKVHPERTRGDVKLASGREEGVESNQRHKSSVEDKRENDRIKPKTLAWVEKHGEVRKVYNTGLASQGSSKEKHVGSGHQPAKGNKNKPLTNSLEPAKALQNSDRIITNKTKKSAHKETTKLKPILQKKVDGGPKSQSVVKKHVRLAVDSLALDKPLLNSTSALAAKLQEIDQDAFDRRKAVSKSLSESEEARSTLAERVADGVNIPKHVRKYPGLISVDIPKQDVLDQAVEEKLMKLTCQPDEEKEKKEVLPTPDVLDVFTPDMIVEYPNLDVSFLTLPQPRLRQVPMDETFHLYQKITSWEK